MSTSEEKPAHPGWVPNAVLGLMIAANVLAGYLLTMRSVDHFVLPAPGGTVTQGSHVYPERVVLAWVAWLTALGAAVALALPFLKRRVTRVWWIVLAVGTLISLNAAMIIGAMPQPVY